MLGYRRVVLFLSRSFSNYSFTSRRVTVFRDAHAREGSRTSVQEAASAKLALETSAEKIEGDRISVEGRKLKTGHGKGGSTWQEKYATLTPPMLGHEIEEELVAENQAATLRPVTLTGGTGGLGVYVDDDGVEDINKEKRYRDDIVNKSGMGFGTKGTTLIKRHGELSEHDEEVVGKRLHTTVKRKPIPPISLELLLPLSVIDLTPSPPSISRRRRRNELRSHCRYRAALFHRRAVTVSALKALSRSSVPSSPGLPPFSVAQLCSIVTGTISVPPAIPSVVPLSPSCSGFALLCSVLGLLASSLKREESGSGGKSTLEELIREEEKKKEKINRKDYWLREGIIVKVHYSRQGQMFKSQVQSMHKEILQSPWLCELMAFHINLRETKVQSRKAHAFFDGCSLTFKDGKPALTCELLDSIKIDIDLTCSICLNFVKKTRKE
ncbi:hypothetical protein Ahy_A09g042832 [Arachis hypogaea]|uniref:Uncharacterized protein n=1 Tax=Arachis hypogaea TaxID=3818 RepID=A0A445BGX5_ARAHY|nr:hypothetical protein Ahy_A09g042832 [Arachis hypogaea]